ncbi:YihY/virulence factor BrkB family protein [soil metagenome]
MQISTLKGQRVNPLMVAPWFAVAALLALWPRERKPPQGPPAEASLSRTSIKTPQAFDADEPGRGRLAAKPSQIPAKGWRDILWRTWKETQGDRLHIVAAGVAFYVLLAVFPAMGAFVSLYGIFADVGEVRGQLAQISALLPPGAVDMVGREMVRLTTSHEASLSATFVLGLVLSLWSANAGMKALFDGMNIAYDETEKRGFLRLNLITLTFTLGAVAFLAGVSAVMVAIPAALGRYGYQVIEVWQLAALWLIVVLAALAAFALIYRFGPSRANARWRWVSWGSSFAGAAWVAGSLGFSSYVQTFGHYEKTYGSLGVLVGFMVWLWFSILMILLGAELNSEIEHQTALDTTTGSPAPIGARGAVMADTVGLAATGANKDRVARRAPAIWGSVRGWLLR